MSVESPSAAPPSALSLEGVRQAYLTGSALSIRSATRTEVLKGISLEIPEGRTLGLVGESGCGKSTLVKSILRLVEPYEGKVLLRPADGSDPVDLLQLKRRDLKRVRRKLQVVFQDPYGSLSPRLPVSEIVSEGLRFHYPKLAESEVLQQVQATLQEVGLPADCAARYPHEFSGGQRQRIAVARALILEPELVILDEPTSALDRTVQKQLVELLRDLQARRGLSYLFISHDLAVVRAMAHRVMVLKDGELIEEGNCRDVLENPTSDYTRALVKAAGLCIDG